VKLASIHRHRKSSLTGLSPDGFYEASASRGAIRSALGFRSQTSAAIILSGIEVVHIMRKRQARNAYNPAPSIAGQFEILAA
jgi:hypothetical protein